MDATAKKRLGSIPLAALGGLALGAASTAGDMVWAAWITQHKAVYGLTHGILLFLAVGLFLGITAAGKQSLFLGALGGPAVGLAAAAAYYVMAPFAGSSAMFISWFGLWILLGFMHGRMFVPREGVRTTAIRGLASATLSGAAFYAISGIWLDHSQPANYFFNFVGWTAAFFLAFLPLLYRRP